MAGPSAPSAVGVGLVPLLSCGVRQAALRVLRSLARAPQGATLWGVAGVTACSDAGTPPWGSQHQNVGGGSSESWRGVAWMFLLA